MSEASAAEAIAAVIEGGRFAAEHGWIPATSGNFSARVDAARAAVTATGTDKGALRPEDVLVVEIDGPAHPRASAEAELHLALYQARPDIGAILHIHSLPAAVLGEQYEAEGQIVLSQVELLKALQGVTTHETRVAVPVFANSQDIPILALEVVPAVAKGWGFVLAGHGLYAWGRTIAEAKRHTEAFDYLFAYHLERERLRR